MLIAKWESLSGKWWVELEHDGTAATYRGQDCGGCLGVMNADTAITVMQKKVDSGYFQPDAAKTKMKRVVLPKRYANADKTCCSYHRTGGAFDLPCTGANGERC